MSFTFLSVVFIICVGIAVLKEVLKGLKLGFSRSLVTLSVVFISAVTSAVIAFFVSDIPAKLLSKTLLNEIPLLDSYSDNLQSVPDIARSVIDAMLTPIIFIILFPVLRAVLTAFVKLFFKSSWTPLKSTPAHIGSYVTPNAADGTSYASADAPWHIRHDRALGALTGALCGFLVALLMLAPVLGTFNMLSGFLDMAEDNKFNWKSIKVSERDIDEFRPYVDDAAAATLNAAGGTFIYDGLAISVLPNGEHISLRKDLGELTEVASDMVTVMKKLSSGEELTAKEKRAAENLGDRCNSSGMVKTIAADLLSGASEKWLEGESFMSIKPPSIGESFDYVLEGLFRTCALSTPSCVGRDIDTLVAAYEIISDYGLTKGMSNDELMEVLDDGNILNELYAELEKNPCMSHLTTALVDTSLSMVASTIDIADITEEQRSKLMEQMAEAVNIANSMSGASFEERVESLTNYTISCASKYGMTVPKEVTTMAATSMLQQLGEKNNMTAAEMNTFLEHQMQQIENGYGSTVDSEYKDVYDDVYKEIEQWKK